MATPQNNSVVRAFDILWYIYDSPRVRTIEEIAAGLELNYKTVHRFLLTLEAIGAVTRIGRGQFTLGMRLADLGQRVAIDRSLRKAARGELSLLVEQFGEAAQIAVRCNDEAVSIAHVPGTKKRSLGMTLGRSLPLHCTAAGKVIVAGMDESKQRAIAKVLRYEQKTTNTLICAQSFLEHIGKVSRLGFAVNDQESQLGYRAVAVPIYNQTDDTFAALSISGVASDMTYPRITELVSMMKESAARISLAVYGKPAN